MDLINLQNINVSYDKKNNILENLNLKVNSLNKEDTVDNIINKNLINIGVVV